MNDNVFRIDCSQLTDLDSHCLQHTVQALEAGQIIYFPQYAFQPQADDHDLLSESILQPTHKNISYDYQNKHVGGLRLSPSQPGLASQMASFMHRFAEYAKHLLDTVVPRYRDHLIWGRTSYRPAEVKDRPSSPRKDDTRVHVDSFPATPVNGQRILRLFCNINPKQVPRVWETGELFQQVLSQFAPTLPKYSATRAKLLRLIKATKSLRSPYDHMMIHLHDRMKLDQQYQSTVHKQRIEFPAFSTWIVFTDQVSHAALSGQHLLEQTFYLPVSAMLDPEQSPLHQWQKMA